jgi:flagella basal body P-ring formation protein FlgA
MRHTLTQITILLAMLAAAAGAQTEVTVTAEVAVSDKILTVGSIATVEGGDPQTVEAIRKVRLGFSPMPGSWRELERDVISGQLSINGFSSSSVSVNAPRLVRIYRRSQTVDTRMLEQRLRDHILANSPWSPDEMNITGITNVGTLAIPAGNLTMEIMKRGSGNYLGHETFIVQLYVDGQEANRVLMQANIRVLRDTLVAARSINAREPISAADVEIRRMDISGAQGDASLTMDEVIGMSARSYIRAGQVITRNQVMRPMLVKRGEVVRLDARSDGFVIQTRGVAQQSGRKGDIIRVLNPTSKKMIEALVVGPQKTEVIF